MNHALDIPRLSEIDARRLTDEVKADAAALWAKLLELYEGGAHTALGYSSWGAYYEAEFDGSSRRGYQVLEAARAVDALSEKSFTPPNEAVARELVPVLREAPEQVEEVWGEVVEEHGERPTAAQVREVVERRAVGPRALGQQVRLVENFAQQARRITELAPHLDLEAVQQLPQEEKEQWRQQLSAARTALSRLIAAL